MAIASVQPIEGNTQLLDGGAMFGNAPRGMWEKWMRPDEKNRIPLATRALLVKTEDGHNYLFETGIGAFFSPELKKRYGVEPSEHILLKNLKKAGVEETEIDGVILSHLHFDHAGGLLPEYGDQPPRLHFPNATYYVGKQHWEYAQNPHSREKASFIPLLHELLENSDRLKLIEGDEHPDLDFGVSFIYSQGHTIGLMLSKLELAEGPMVFVSDLVPCNVMVHLPITMGYDRFPELKVDEKKKLYEDLIERNGRLFFTHDPEISVAYLRQDDKGRYYGEGCSMNGN